MNKKISFIFLLWMCMVGFVSAQNRVEQREQLLKYTNIEPGGNIHAVFSLLSVHNEKNIRSLSLELGYRQFVQEDSAGSVRISWDQISLSGDVFFRDFNFDTLILPDMVEIGLSWFDNKTGLNSQQYFTTSFPNKNLTLKLDGYHGEEVMIVNSFELSDKKLERFIHAANMVNHYYGYGIILNEIRSKDQVTGLAVPFLNYVDIHRALVNIGSLGIIDLLHLKQHDPQRFLSFYRKAKRLEVRWHTLAKQEFSRVNKGGEIDAFVNGLVQLSVDYLVEKRHYQPYIASSFEQMALLHGDKKIIAFYHRVCEELDRYNQKSTAQQVFDRFLFQAGEYEKSGEFVYALMMLDNAKTWADKIADIEPAATFNMHYTRALDGLLSMYIRVAAAGFRTGNEDMANKYVVKAVDLYRLETLEYPNLSKQSLVNFQKELIAVFEILLKKEHFQNVLDLLFEFQGLHYTPVQRVQVVEIASQSKKGLFDKSIQRVQTAYNNGYLDEAYKSINDVKDFQELNTDSTKSWQLSINRLNDLAYKLIESFVKKGEKLLDEGKNADAMENFAKALQLQNRFLDYRVEQLDSLMNQTVIPIIMKKIEEAQLLVWSNRLDSAYRLYDEVVDRQKYYHLENDSRINKMIFDLEQKLNNRRCVNATYSLLNFMQVVQNRIDSKKWTEAAETMNKADKVVKQSKGCDLDTVVFKRLKREFGSAFEYVLKLKEVKSDLYVYGFDSVWKTFADLDLCYQKHRLKRLDVEESGFKSVLLNRNESGEIEAVVRYYLSLEESLQAFDYLLLLRGSNLSRSKVKELQVEVGRKMAWQLSTQQFEKAVNKQDKWLKPLVKTYLTNIE